MEKIATELNDCFILEPKRFGDKRGYFESITKEQLDELGFNGIYQVSNSKSGKGIVRGLHFQKDPYCQAKVVRCHRGAVIDVVVDIRRDSSSFGKHVAVLLTPDNGRMLYVPRGFAHGFVSLSDDTLFEYYVDNKYMPRMEDGILWNDPELGIDWDGIFKEYGIVDPILSDKDKDRRKLSQLDTDFSRKGKKYLITGSKGQLGYDIIRELIDRGETNILAVDKDEMDITDSEQVVKIVKNFNPDVIFHCAAWTAVDKAEEMQDDAYKVNVEGTKNITDASIEIGAKLVYISTDYVFDGTKDGLYSVDDEPNPQSVYGRTKFLGEEEVKRNPNHFIARISWAFGIGGKNFVRTMLELSDKYDSLNVVNDQFGSPTYTFDLAKILVEMVQTDKYGIYHINNDGYCSWAEFAEYIMRSNGKKTIINPVSTDVYYKGKDMSKIAYRPKNSRLDRSALVDNGFYVLPDWKDATDRYCKELEKSFRK